MIRYRKISTALEVPEGIGTLAYARSMYTITKKLLIAAGFVECDYPAISPGEYAYFGSGGNNVVAAREITVLKWHNIGLVIFFGVNNSTYLSPFVIRANLNGEYQKWDSDRIFISDNKPDWFNGNIRSTTLNALDIIYWMDPKDFTGVGTIRAGSIDCYSDENFLFIEKGHNPDKNLWYDEKTNSRDGKLSVYYCDGANIILSDLNGSQVTPSVQKILRYSDNTYLNTNQAMPFTTITDDGSDHIICPRLYQLDFAMSLSTYLDHYGQWSYNKRRVGEKRLFELMGQKFFYLSGKTAIIP